MKYTNAILGLLLTILMISLGVLFSPQINMSEASNIDFPWTMGLGVVLLLMLTSLYYLTGSKSAFKGICKLIICTVLFAGGFSFLVNLKNGAIFQKHYSKKGMVDITKIRTDGQCNLTNKPTLMPYAISSNDTMIILCPYTKLSDIEYRTTNAAWDTLGK